MADELPPHLVDLQRSAHAAWDEVEAHRKQVDAAREADTPDEPGRPAWVARPQRPWSDEENAEYDRLHAAAVAAQEAVRAGITEAGLSPGYEVVQGLHKAAHGA